MQRLSSSQRPPYLNTYLVRGNAAKAVLETLVVQYMWVLPDKHPFTFWLLHNTSSALAFTQHGSWTLLSLSMGAGHNFHSAWELDIGT